jgi:hypothetical protein
MNRKFKTYILPIVLSIFVVIGFILWIASDGDLKDFGLNFFTEILGVVITVLIIDKLVKDREQKKMAPLKLAEYEDALRLYSEFVSFWKDAYMISVNEEFPETYKEFLSENGIGKVFINLNLNTKPNVAPPRTWWTWILDNHKKWIEGCDKYLERHSAYSDPELFKLIHGFAEGAFMKLLPMISTIKQLDQKEQFPRLPTLGNYAIQPQKIDYENLINIHSCLNRIYKDLSKEFTSVRKFKYETVALEKRKVVCGLTDEDIKEFLERKQKYEQAQKK